MKMSSMQQSEPAPFARLYERYGDPTEDLHAAYNSWLANMASRNGNVLVPFEFDQGNYPEQSIYIPKVEAEPARPDVPDWKYYLGFEWQMSRSIGRVALPRLVHQFSNQAASLEDHTPLPERLNANQQAGKNTLIVTSHIKFQEMGYVKTIRHLAKRDRAYIPKSGVVLNKLMTRQSYKGKTLVERFKPVGHVYFSSPPSLSAEQHGVPQAAATLTNALFLKVLKPDLAAGGLELDAALTGSEIKPQYDKPEHVSHYSIPEIPIQSAKLIELFDEALGITLVGPPLLRRWHMHISDMLDVKELLKTNTSAEVTDMIYADIVNALERFTKKDVQYSKVSDAAGKQALRAVNEV